MLSSFQVFSVILVVDFSAWSDKTLCKQTVETKFAKWDDSILENGKNGLKCSIKRITKKKRD